MPDFDVLVTNPPFSGDNMERALAYAASCGKPWALLMPDFVSRKAYYAAKLGISRRAAVAAASGATSGATTAEQPLPHGLDSKLRRQQLKQAQRAEDEEEGEGAGGDVEAAAAATAALPEFSPLCGHLYYLGPRQRPYMFTAPAAAAPMPTSEVSAAAGSGGGDGGTVAGQQQQLKQQQQQQLQAPRAFTPASFQCVWFLGLGGGKDGDGARQMIRCGTWGGQTLCLQNALCAALDFQWSPCCLYESAQDNPGDHMQVVVQQA